jgi:hypothetical protein
MRGVKRTAGTMIPVAAWLAGTVILLLLVTS